MIYLAYHDVLGECWQLYRRDVLTATVLVMVLLLLLLLLSRFIVYGLHLAIGLLLIGLPLLLLFHQGIEDGLRRLINRVARTNLTYLVCLSSLDKLILRQRNEGSPVLELRLGIHAKAHLLKLLLIVILLLLPLRFLCSW